MFGVNFLANGGLVFYDLSDPGNPRYVGDYGDDGYTHDVECIVYNGPDKKYIGREICFAYNEDSVAIIDVTNKSNSTMISRTEYVNSEYCHQGWIDESHRYIFMDDELDEYFLNLTASTTFVFNVSDLENPYLINNDPYESPTHGSIDHNHYVWGKYLYQAHNRAGFRVLDISDASNLIEVGYFDTYISDDNAQFDGLWSVFPYFDSGILIGQDRAKGLFVLRFRGNLDDCNKNEWLCPKDKCCIPNTYINDNYCDCRYVQHEYI